MVHVAEVLVNERARALPELLRLVALERGRVGTLLNVQEPAFYERMLGDGGATFIAVEDGRLLGFACLAGRESVHPFWSPHLDRLGVDRSRTGVLIHAIVDPAAHGRGVGRALLVARMAAARGRGLDLLVSTVDPDNAACLGLLEGAGFRRLETRRVYSANVLRVLLARDLAGAPRSAD